VGHARVAKKIPVVPPLDRRLVAVGQCCEHAGGAPVGNGRIDGVTHALAQSVDRIARRFGDQARRRCVAHIAGGANALLEQLELVVEAVRIQVAMRPAQPHRESPALAGAQFALRLRQCRILMKTCVPAQRDIGRQGKPAGAPRGIVQREAKTQPARPLLRQARNHTCQNQIAPFKVGRECVGETTLGLPACDAEAGEPGPDDGD